MLSVAARPANSTFLIAPVAAAASYVDNYYTASIGRVANDLRIRIYEHLQRLSLRFYDTAKSGSPMSTITSDVATVQNLASSSTPGGVYAELHRIEYETKAEPMGAAW